MSWVGSLRKETGSGSAAAGRRNSDRVLLASGEPGGNFSSFVLAMHAQLGGSGFNELDRLAQKSPLLLVGGGQHPQADSKKAVGSGLVTCGSSKGVVVEES